jgi:hypothetical protein
VQKYNFNKVHIKTKIYEEILAKLTALASFCAAFLREVPFGKIAFTTALAGLCLSNSLLLEGTITASLAEDALFRLSLPEETLNSTGLPRNTKP